MRLYLMGGRKVHSQRGRDEHELRQLGTEPRTAMLPQLLTPDDLAGGG